MQVAYLVFANVAIAYFLSDGSEDMDREDAIDIGMAARGDRVAAARLYDRYARQVFGIGRSMLGTREEAEDIVQDVFVKLWRNVQTLDERTTPVRPWLLRVTTNLCIDRIRKHRETLSEEPIEIADPANDPYQDLKQSELAGHIDRAFAALPERQRMALTLTAKMEMSTREAGDAMGLGERAMESLIARGRKSLRLLLKPVAEDYLVE